MLLHISRKRLQLRAAFSGWLSGQPIGNSRVHQRNLPPFRIWYFIGGRRRLQTNIKQNVGSLSVNWVAGALGSCQKECDDATCLPRASRSCKPFQTPTLPSARAGKRPRNHRPIRCLLNAPASFQDSREHLDRLLSICDKAHAARQQLSHNQRPVLKEPSRKCKVKQNSCEPK